MNALIRRNQQIRMKRAFLSFIMIAFTGCSSFTLRDHSSPSEPPQSLWRVQTDIVNEQATQTEQLNLQTVSIPEFNNS